ncbi:MAG TPA: sialidase family protein, partial [Phycisphaerales bacterium]|nr:sialidase family protein [Phycisphaerales bacterium]
MKSIRSVVIVCSALFMHAWAASVAQAQFSAPLSPKSALNSNAAADVGGDKSASLAATPSGTVIVVWDSDENINNAIGTDRDILLVRSTNGGQSWTAPTRLNTDANTDDPSDQDTAPQIATDNLGHWVVVWVADRASPRGPRDLDIRASTSLDDGVTWSTPVAVNANTQTDQGTDDSPTIATDAAGNWIVVWRTLDSQQGAIGTDGDLLFAKSINNGATWTTQQILNTNAGSDSGSDSKPAISADHAGNWIVAWRSTDSLSGTIGTDADILFARSVNAGASWSAPAALNSNAASDGSGADDLPRLVVTSNGNFVAVWSSTSSLGGTIGTDEDILFARSSNGGVNWSAPAALNSTAVSDGTSTDREADISCNG